MSKNKDKLLDKHLLDSEYLLDEQEDLDSFYRNFEEKEVIDDLKLDNEY